jgi:hypothetical protein
MQTQGISPTTWPQIDTTNNRSVRYKTHIYSTSRVDLGLGPADDTNNSIIYTPEESCLSSGGLSPDLTAEPGSSNMNPQDFQDAMRLALVGILKDFASGLSM